MKNQKNNTSILLIIIILTIINTILLNSCVDDEVYVNSFSNVISSDMMMKLLLLRRKLVWLSYVVVIIMLLLRLCAVVLCLYVGALYIGYKIKISNFFRTVLLSELVIVGVSFVRTVLIFYNEPQTLDEIRSLEFPSLVSLVSKENIPEYLHYFSSLISIPNMLYWVTLALMLRGTISAPFISRIGFISKTYGVGLFVWGSFITFLVLEAGV